eukprot:3598996-Pleurochrysis_carterae.AAC.3
MRLRMFAVTASFAKAAYTAPFVLTQRLLCSHSAFCAHTAPFAGAGNIELAESAGSLLHPSHSFSSRGTRRRNSLSPSGTSTPALKENGASAPKLRPCFFNRAASATSDVVILAGHGSRCAREGDHVPDVGHAWGTDRERNRERRRVKVAGEEEGLQGRGSREGSKRERRLKGACGISSFVHAEERAAKAKAKRVKRSRLQRKMGIREKKQLERKQNR